MARRSSRWPAKTAASAGAVSGHVDGANRLLGEMGASMSAIEQSSRKVTGIVKAIDEIAFQTNILALNAAVEAARAGAAGLGFAVVADEVRSLAQRAATAARDATALVEDSVRSAREGTSRLGRFRDAMSQVMSWAASPAARTRAQRSHPLRAAPGRGGRAIGTAVGSCAWPELPKTCDDP